MTANLERGRVVLLQKTGYPWEGDIRFEVFPETPQEFTLAVRIPGWCREAKIRVNGEEADVSPLVERGYAKIRRLWQRGDRVELSLAMPVERVRAHPGVRDASGKVALQRGPVVFCLEEADNGPGLSQIVLPEEAELCATFRPELLEGVVVLSGEAEREVPASSRLYAFRRPERRRVPLTAIPYYAWGNRGMGEMTVWIREK